MALMLSNKSNAELSKMNFELDARYILLGYIVEKPLSH